MKVLAAIALAFGLAAAAPSQAQTQPTRTFEGVYSVYARGVEAGDFTYNFSQNGASYQATARREMKGMVGALFGRSQDYNYSVRGAVTAGGALQPEAYQHQGGRRGEDRPNGRIVRATFTATDVVTVSDPPGMSMGHPRATPEQRRAVVDQISAIASLVVSSGDPCTRTVNVYMDGRSRFDFVLTPNGTVNVDSRAYRGEAVRCRVEFRPIAGFSDPQEAATLSFVFARTPSGMWAPITIEMPTDGVGVVRLQARRLTFNGQRLR
jgi:hypothetical protein